MNISSLRCPSCFYQTRIYHVLYPIYDSKLFNLENMEKYVSVDQGFEGERDSYFMC